MSFDNYIFRCSQLGMLMTEPRSGKGLSETTKSYLSEVFIERRFGRRREIKSKYLDKGIQVEEDSLDIYSMHSMQYVAKNEERFRNEWIIGTPDVVTPVLLDIKSSWDIWSFAKAKTEENKMYFWQLQGYMWLTGHTSATLAYVLTDTPEHIIERELRQALYQSGLSQDSGAYQEYVAEMIRVYRYADLDISQRVHCKEYAFDGEAIQRLQDRIALCREELNKIQW